MKGLIEITENISKIQPETTRGLKDIFGSLERMGRSNMLAPIQQSLMMPSRQFGLQMGNVIQSALMPMTIGMNQLINQMNNAIIPFIEQNRMGAGIGGMAGFVAGFVLPGGPALWGMVGTVAGAWIEQLSGGFDLDQAKYVYRTDPTPPQNIGPAGVWTTPTAGGHYAPEFTEPLDATPTYIGSRPYERVF